MALPQGIEFRHTDAFVTTAPANYDVNSDNTASSGTYPQTSAQGNTVGWEVADATLTSAYRDRESGNDARLAGRNSDSTSDAAYRIDLPSSGNYNIGIAAGDAWYAQSVAWDLYDTASSLGSLTTGSTSAANYFKDATNTEYSNTAWPGSQTLVSKTFSTTICRFKQVGASQVIASVYVEAGAAGARYILGSH